MWERHPNNWLCCPHLLMQIFPLYSCCPICQHGFHCTPEVWHQFNISKIRNILYQSDAAKLVCAFFYFQYNLLLSGCSKSPLKNLQFTQREHISPISASLHWLPGKSRIEFKIILFTYNVLNNQEPSNLSDVIVPYHLIRALHSQTVNLLVVS